MKHELVPEHKILSPADKRELLRKCVALPLSPATAVVCPTRAAIRYHVTEAQLPRILVTGVLPPPRAVTRSHAPPPLQTPCPSSSG